LTDGGIKNFLKVCEKEKKFIIKTKNDGLL
jgi:hypothetical protein